MAEMVLLRYEKGSKLANTACPVCGRISKRMLFEQYSGRVKNKLGRSHTCPVCATVYDTCKSAKRNEWSAAIASYLKNATQYNSMVKDNYVRHEQDGDNSVITNSGDELTVTSNTANKMKSDDLKREQIIISKRNTTKEIDMNASKQEADDIKLTKDKTSFTSKNTDIQLARKDSAKEFEGLDRRVERWKKELLDTSKRNKMINYRESKRVTLKILEPNAEELFNELTNDKTLTFQRPVNKDSDVRSYSILSLLETFNYPLSVQRGDIKADGTIIEREKTLKNLRSKAKLAQEEQGTNILYLSFGFIYWKEKNVASAQWIKSPLLMMPVSLGIKSLNAPYTLAKYDDEIEVNPTLNYLFSEEYGIDLPTFEYKNKDSFEEYMTAIEEIVDRKGWKLTREVNLGLLSFLKISMYHDLNNNHEKIVNNPVLRAICGEPTAIEQLPAVEYLGIDQENPVECHEVVDSDSSQAEAIRLSKLGVSFVMQGPPGTGKSQTITNIISEALADGKKVLFVSEKSAALHVVLKRLTEASLDEFCLSLHNYKANKKDIIDNIGANLNLNREYNNRNIMNDLIELFQDRKYLNQYVNQLHKTIDPLGESIYTVYGKLLKLEKASTLDFKLKEPTQMSRVEYASVLYVVTAFEKALHNLDGALTDNPWYKTTVKSSSQIFKKQMLKETGTIPEKMASLEAEITTFNKLNHTNIGLDWKSSQQGIIEIKELLSLPMFPYWWMDLDKQEALLLTAKYEKAEQKGYYNGLEECCSFFNDAVLNANLDLWKSKLEIVLTELSKAGFSQGNYGHLNCSSLISNSELKEIISSLRKISEAYRYANNFLGLKKIDSFKHTKVMARLLSLLKEIPQIIQSNWFLRKNNEMAFNQLVESVKHSENLNKLLSSVTEKWKDIVFGIDTEGVKQTFKNENSWIYEKSKNDMEECVDDVINEAKNILEELYLIIDSYQMAKDLLNLELNTNIRNVQLASDLLRILADAPYMEALWFDTRNHDEIHALIDETSIHDRRISDLTVKILEDWEPNTLLSIDVEGMLGRFKTEYEGIFYKYRSNYKNDMKTMKLLSKHVGRKIDKSDVVGLLQSLKEIENEKQWYVNNKDVLRRTFGNQIDAENTNWENIRNGVKCAADIANLFPYSNISKGVINAIQNSFSNISDFAQIRELCDLLSSERLEHCIEKMSRTQFLFEYSETALLDQFIVNQIEKFIVDCEEQRNSIIMLNSAFISGRRICYQDFLTLLMNVSAINIEKTWFHSMEDVHCELFGGKSYNECSDWVSISSGLKFTKEIIDLFSNSVPKSITDYICNGNDTEVLFSNTIILTESDISEVSMKLFDLISHIYEEDVSINDRIIPSLQAYDTATDIFISISAEISSYMKSDASLQDLVENIDSVISVRNCKDKILMNSADLSSQFGGKYIGINTDWDSIINDINAIKDYVSKYGKNLPSALIEKICNNDVKRGTVKSEIEKIYDLLIEVKEPLVSFEGYFNSDTEFQTLGFSKLIERYNSCLNRFAELSKWLDFTEAMADCNKLGLSSFTEAIVAKNNIIDDIKDAFEKGFYTQWAELAMSDIPAVDTFRKRVHENRLDKFVSSDEKQFKLAQMRVRDKIISTFPTKNQISKADSEIRTLRHEMGKKRRVMPLRKLFHSIPSLLLTLKPCLMMSPLSVAYFLDADYYKFDMVIFDEASQIFPQDAIGTIFRAKQVVIAGDLKQLPPTNFFATSTGNSNNDVFDDDSYEDEVFDSILEETANILPTRTLLWHYRSKHEHLIAFSNQEIYRNELVTFPSCSEKEPDIGVEFIYVPEGYYEGGGKNCNLLEARRMVELVKDHFDKYPKRSLGIIAFSEKQQQAISMEIQRFRERNPKYEEFFLEGKEDEFFVKNLENVQGDERDTIFFSVGYAKTKEQKATNKPMAMRFGPLGVQGGERRLNVAITRAKLNIKLVSSIVPSDIDLIRTESEGIKMLRSYIEFAMNGEATLASTHVNVRQDDFIDSIANLLKKKGYKIRKYVGCSGYKIDIVIEHPSYEAHFVAGIECDGFSYASAKTARDRDRLRKSVLTNMGWRLYRVWSTEWHKNPEIESDKLIDFVEKSITDSTVRLEALAKEKQIDEANRLIELEKEKAEREREMRKIAVEERRQREKLDAIKEKASQHKDKKSALEKVDRKYLPEIEKYKNDEEKMDRFSGMDRTWIKIGVPVHSKSFGLGTISQIDGNYIEIQFEKDNKQFAYPDAFINGYLYRESQD